MTDQDLQMSSGSDNTAAIIGGVVAMVFIIAMAIIVIVLGLRNQRAKLDLRQERYDALPIYTLQL